jgi:hypothetical protein
MDPQKNVNPTTSDEEKDAAAVQPGASQDPTTTPAAPTDDLSMGTAADTTPKDDAAMSMPDMSDESKPATDVALGGEDQTPPADPTATTAPTPDMAPPASVTPDQPPVSAAPDTTPPADTSAPANPVSGVTMPSADMTPDAQGPVSGTTVAPGSDPSAMPQTAPAAAPHGEKKTMLVLVGVAVILIVAIAVLYFM